MRNLTFGILGYGIVGKATHKALLKDQKVIIHDLSLGTDEKSLSQCDYIFICIPTVCQQDIDLLINIVKQFRDKKIILRSTVPIGTCNLLKEQHGINVHYIPEFLRDRYWDTDCLTYPLLVGQGDDLDLSMLTIDNKIINCTNEDLELVKMFSNNIAVLKIVFANHFYDLTQQTGCDYNLVVDMYNKVKNDQSYLEANDDLRGFGGKCLPKDLEFLINTFKQFDIEQTLFTSLQQDNKKWPIHIRKS